MGNIRRLVLIVARLKVANAPTRMDVKLQRDKLGLGDGDLILKDPYTQETLRIEGNEFSTPIHRNDFRGFVLEPAAD